jgi:hypothetical protein
MAAPRVIRTLKKVQRAIIKAVQAVVVPILLTLVYLLLLGLTWPLALLLAPRKGLGLFAARSDSYWTKADGYEPELQTLMEPF